ncbi:MAG: SDR family oxidoreductase [Acidobacteria bacterium]|nr:MAG: SDR family oxidoreductase [Acidobacteriota bacterium]
MDLGLEGKAALVTGGAGGIGRAIVRALLDEGCRVAVLDAEGRAAAACRELDPGGEATVALDADVTDFQGAERAVGEAKRAFGRLDILVCCAGITRDHVSWKMPEESWDAVLAVNLKGVFNYNRAAGRLFKEQGSGRIVNISSINGLRGKFGQANYSASKAGVVGLTRTMARELGRYGVTVNAVAPGMIETAMARSVPPEFLEEARREAALGRLGAPEDVAWAVVFLCSDRARHITGDVLKVDGGQIT